MDRLRLATCTVDLRALKVVADDGAIQPLSAKEAALLQILAREPGRAIPRETLYAEVWGYGSAVVSRALDTMIRRLRQKVEADPTDPKHLLTAHGEGYRFEPSPGGARPSGYLAAIGLVGRAASPGAWLERVAALIDESGGVRLSREGDEQVLTFVSAARAAELCLAAVDGSPEARGAGCVAPFDGDGVARVRRLLAATGAGRVMLASDLYAEVSAATGVRSRSWRSIGGVRLSLDGPPERLYATGSPDTLRPADGNLAPPVLPLVGRVVDRARVLDLLRHERVVTITGTGGVGKTRLALDVGQAWRATGGGAWFCDLSACATADDVTVTIARALGVPLGPTTELRCAVAAIDGDLVVLDNAEQVLTAVREELGRWSDEERLARVLVTSRERTGVPGERVVELEPLPEDDAVALFQERAANIGVGVDDSAPVRGLVTRLDGLPLAIELAAARTEILSPAELLGRLDRSLGAIGADPARTPRHADLQAAVRWSWELLDPREQQVLVACAVFSGPFAAADAEAVAGGAGVLDALHGLRRKGLLRPVTLRPDVRRFAPYAAVAAFVDRIADPAETEAARDRHARWYGRWGTAAVDDALEAGDEALLQRIVDDLPELLAAVTHALPRSPEVAVEAYVGAAIVLVALGPTDALEPLARRVLAVSDDLRIQVGRVHSTVAMDVLREVDRAIGRHTSCRALLWRGFLAFELGGIAPVWDCAVRATALARAAGDELGVARGVELIARIAGRLGQEELGGQAWEEILRAAIQHGWRRIQRRCRVALARVAARRGSMDEALRYAGEAVDNAASGLDSRLWIDAVSLLGMVHRMRGEGVPALARTRDAVIALRRIGDRGALPMVWVRYGHCLAAWSGVAEARAAHLEALRCEERLGGNRSLGSAASAIASLDLVEGRLDEAIARLDAVLEAQQSSPTQTSADLATRALARIARGELSEALVDLDRSLALSAPITDPRPEASARLIRAVCRMRLGDRAGAEEDRARAAVLVARVGPSVDAVEFAVRDVELTMAAGGDVARAVSRARRELAAYGMGEGTLLALELRRVTGAA